MDVIFFVWKKKTKFLGIQHNNPWNNLHQFVFFSFSFWDRRDVCYFSFCELEVFFFSTFDIKLGYFAVKKNKLILKCKIKTKLYILGESAIKMRIPLTISGVRLQFTDLAYSCGFRNSSILLNMYLIYCLWILQTVPDSAKTLQISQDFLFLE